MADARSDGMRPARGDPGGGGGGVASGRTARGGTVSVRNDRGPERRHDGGERGAAGSGRLAPDPPDGTPDGTPDVVRRTVGEWLMDGRERAASGRTHGEVGACVAPLLRRVTRWWAGDTLPLAIDATTLDDRLVGLAVSVLYRGSTLPVAWSILPARQRRLPARRLVTGPGHGWVGPATGFGIQGGAAASVRHGSGGVGGGRCRGLDAADHPLAHPGECGLVRRTQGGRPGLPRAHAPGQARGPDPAHRPDACRTLLAGTRAGDARAAGRGPLEPGRPPRLHHPAPSGVRRPVSCAAAAAGCSPRSSMVWPGRGAGGASQPMCQPMCPCPRPASGSSPSTSPPHPSTSQRPPPVSHAAGEGRQVPAMVELSSPPPLHGRGAGGGGWPA